MWYLIRAAVQNVRINLDQLRIKHQIDSQLCDSICAAYVQACLQHTSIAWHCSMSILNKNMNCWPSSYELLVDTSQLTGTCSVSLDFCMNFFATIKFNNSNSSVLALILYLHAKRRSAVLLKLLNVEHSLHCKQACTYVSCTN